MCTGITIIDDVILEPLQSFIVMLNATDPNVVIISDQLQINIVDNDGKVAVKLSFLLFNFPLYDNCTVAIDIMVPPNIIVHEYDGVANICVSVTGNSQAQREVAVELSISSGGSATG